MITPEDVKNDMIKAEIKEVKVRNCSMCEASLKYKRKGEDLYYDSGCACIVGHPENLNPRDWEAVVSWIEMQDTFEHKKSIAERFGLNITEKEDELFPRV